MTGNVKTCAGVGVLVNEEVLEVFPIVNPGGTRPWCDEEFALNISSQYSF